MSQSLSHCRPCSPTKGHKGDSPKNCFLRNLPYTLPCLSMLHCRPVLPLPLLPLLRSFAISRMPRVWSSSTSGYCQPHLGSASKLVSLSTDLKVLDLHELRQAVKRDSSQALWTKSLLQSQIYTFNMAHSWQDIWHSSLTGLLFLQLKAFYKDKSLQQISRNQCGDDITWGL